MTADLADLADLDRPSWRGRLHTWAFVAAFPLGAALVLGARGPMATTAAGIYVATILIGFGTSAAYHRLAHTPRARAIMQRLDHSAIYLLIAGTYVPICLIALPRAWGVPLLAAVAAGATLGVILKLVAFGRVRWLSYSLYPVLGWAAVAAFPALVHHLSPVQLGLVVAGGLAYTAGFPVLLTRWPDPMPRVFGYHEVWHALTVVAAALHFSAVASLVV